MKFKSTASLQKLYDESYRLCATAVLFESRENEDEAFRCWRTALSKIQSHTRSGSTSSAGRRPSVRPQSETEKSLIESLHELELRCQERVDLYETLKLSREEEERSRNVIRAWNGGDLSPSPASVRGPREQPPRWSQGHSNSSSLDRPPHDPEPPSSWGSSTTRLPPETLPPNVTAQPMVNRRMASPEKKGFLTTLRPSSQVGKKTPRVLVTKANKGHGVAAAKAASRAWSSTGRLDALYDETGTYMNSSSYEINNLPSRGSTPGSSTDLRLNTTVSHNSAPDAIESERNNSPVPRYQERRKIQRPIEQETDYFTDTNSLYTTGYPEASPPPPRPPKTPMKGHGPRPDSFPHGDYKERIPESLLTERLKEMTLYKSDPYAGGGGGGRGGAPFELDAGPSVPMKEPGQGRKGKNVVEPPLEAGAGIGVPANPTSLHSEEKDTPEDVTLHNRFKQALKDLGNKIDADAANQIINDIVLHGDEVHWEDIAGLDAAKLALKEAVVYPFLRPDLFSGLREPARGMLLFGPPGTGKTMLAKAVATESKSTFFAISASSLTSKYLGESEKLVKTLFTLAKALAPSIIFVDEIDSLLSNRNSNSDTEATIRIKTEFLIQWSDLARAAAGRKVEPGCGDPSRVLVLAATNVPWAIDEAARRRFVRRQYIPLPEGPVRVKQLRTLLSHQKHELSEDDLKCLESLTEGFSCSDITALAKDAAMGPLRNLGEALLHMRMDQIRPIGLRDFIASLGSIRPSVSRDGLQRFEDWANQYGERV